MWRENYTVIIIIIMSSKVKENLKKSLKNPLQRVNFLKLEPCFIVLPPEAQWLAEKMLKNLVEWKNNEQMDS